MNEETIKAAIHVVNMYDQSMTGRIPRNSREMFLDEAIKGLRYHLNINGQKTILTAEQAEK